MIILSQDDIEILLWKPVPFVTDPKILSFLSEYIPIQAKKIHDKLKGEIDG